jgi:hypothetical protein
MSTISIGAARAFQRRPEGLPGLWSALDVAVLEETGDGYFASLDVLPAWFLDLTAGTGDGAAFDLAERFPFLEYFLEDARAFWASEMPGRLESGPWSETAPDGGELALEATALFHAEKRIVLISLLGKEYEERRRLLQRIRDTYLDLQSLSRGSTALGCAAAAQSSVLAGIPDTMFRLRRDGSYLDFTSEDGFGAKPPRLSRQGNVSDVLPAEAACAQVVVARHRLDPCRGDADDRLGERLVVVADPLEVRTGGCAMRPVGERARTMLGVKAGHSRRA